MPRKIVATERDRNSYREQMKLTVGDPGVWFRIDKGDGSIVHVGSVAVVRAAQANFKRPNHAIATCRFSTPFAIYCTGDRLTEEERKAAVA